MTRDEYVRKAAERLRDLTPPPAAALDDHANVTTPVPGPSRRAHVLNPDLRQWLHAEEYARRELREFARTLRVTANDRSLMAELLDHFGLGVAPVPDAILRAVADLAEQAAGGPSRHAQEPDCICWDGSPDNFEGPQRDCPIRGEQGIIARAEER